MEVLDFFNTTDGAFSMASMTDAISDVDHMPNQLGAMNLFAVEGVPTRTIIIEEDPDSRKLVATAPWGSPGSTRALGKRKVRSFVIPHMPTQAAVTAEEIQNVRAYAQGMSPQQALLTVEQLRNKKLKQMRDDLEVTLEYHRMGALSGKLLDSDGTTVIYDLFDEFDVTIQEHNMVLDTTTTNVNGKVRAAIRLALAKIKGLPVSGWGALCGDSFFDKFIGHGKVEDKYLNWQGAVSILSSEHRAYGNFQYAGVEWMNYRGSVGGVDFVPSTKAYLFPIGVPGLFISKFGPSDYIDRVNQIPSPDGLPIEVRAELLRMGKGVEMEAQSNPLHLCTKPDAIIVLKENT